MSKLRLVILSLTLLLTLSGCIKFNNEQTQVSAQGGIFKSVDQGMSWAPAQLISTPLAQQVGIEGTNITTITNDPQDPQTLYIGTEVNGVFFSYDGGGSWNQFESLSTGNILSIAVHPKDKCTIFVSTANRILQSSDCSRTWQQMYFDPRTDALVQSIAIDTFDPTIMYGGTGYGDVLKSTDSGKSWKTVQRLNTRIKKILIGPDTRTVFVATEYNGIYKTTDKGATWNQIIQEFQQAEIDPGEFKDMRYDYRNNVLIVSSSYGLLKSADEGKTWESIPLITAPHEVQISALAVNPENAQEMYYGTDTTFYKTLDGGANWIPQQLPTASKANTMHIDPENGQVLYLGFKKFQQ